MFRQSSPNIFISFLVFIFLYSVLFSQGKEKVQFLNSSFKLPAPNLDGRISVEKALNNRRSVRDYSDESLSISELSQILWAAQGITQKIEEPPSAWHRKQWMGGLRTAPSAGALYPIELYAAVGKVEGLSPGLYKYNPKQHSILKVMDGDKRDDISNSALKQNCIRNGAVNIIIVGIYERTAVKYGERAERYVQIESGAVCQNIYLQSYTLGLGTVIVGAFKDESLKSTLNLPENEHPLGIMPIGKITDE